MIEIFCHKLQRNAIRMETAPFPGELGEKIFQEISREAWSDWLSHQTLLINEYRLNLIDPNSRSFLREEMQKYLFGAGSEQPAGFVKE